MAQGPRAGRCLAHRRGGRRAGALVVAVLLVVSGCGGRDGDSDAPRPEATTSSGTPGPSPSPSQSTAQVPDPTLPTARPSAGVQLSGVVRRAPEERSVVLEADASGGRPAQSWVLVGPISGLRDAERVTVTGRPDPDALTTGQRGPVFVVSDVSRD